MSYRKFYHEVIRLTDDLNFVDSKLTIHLYISYPPNNILAPLDTVSSDIPNDDAAAYTTRPKNEIKRIQGEHLIRC